MIKKILIVATISSGILFADGQNVATMTNVKASIEALIDAYYKIDKKQNAYDGALKDTNATINKRMLQLIESMNFFKESVLTKQEDINGSIQKLEGAIYSDKNIVKKCSNDSKDDDIIKKYLSK